jgi:NAD-dependent SIR2 family protein deacetylase
MATVKNPIVTCDECKKQFKLKPKRIEKEKVVEGIDRTFFKCPYCKRKYVVTYEDGEFKQNISDMKVLREEMANVQLDTVEYKAALKEYDELYKRNIEISKGYKKIYGS